VIRNKCAGQNILNGTSLKGSLKKDNHGVCFFLWITASEPLALISCPASRAGQTTLNTTFHPVRAMMDAFVFIAVLAWAAKSWLENNH
jgi:hypothetical protein